MNKALDFIDISAILCYYNKVLFCTCGGIGSFEHERCRWQIQRVRKGVAVKIADFGYRKPSRGRV